MQSINPNSVFVVSGGAKGITAQCVVEMARAYHCRFILLGRSRLLDAEPAWASSAHTADELKRACAADFSARGEKPTPAGVTKAVNAVLSHREIHETLDAIRDAGGQAAYAAADITDRDAVRAAIQSVTQFGAVTGIVHGAGNLADKLIEKKTPDDFEWVYAAKIHGLENLLAVCPPATLQTLVLFSSVAGFFGNVGQADYAIANEILNKTAHQLKAQYPALRVISINWGPWDGGMVTPQLRAYFNELGVQVIPPHVGTQMLIDELNAPTTDTVQTIVGSAISAPPRQPDGELKTFTVNRRLTLAQNPFLRDHVIDGKAVMPMVSAMAWIANTAEQTHPGYHYTGFENYKVLKGIVFDETLADLYTLELKEVSKSAQRIELDAMISSTVNGKPRFHYSTRLILSDKRLPAPVYTLPDDPKAETVNIPGKTFYDSKVLFHMRSFQGVQELIHISRDGLLMRCQLTPVDEAYQGQFPIQSFNYFMADIGLQSIGIYARRMFDAGSLPLRAGHGEQYGSVKFGQTFYAYMRVLYVSETDVSAEIAIMDEDYRLYMLVRDIAVTMNKRLNDLFIRNEVVEGK